MRPDLFDVLVQAKAEAPPPRIGVDEIVTAGKRRQRRRTAGFVIAVVIAAAVAITVPQLVTRPVAEQPATPRMPGPYFTFSEFTAGQLRIANPGEWRRTWQRAMVTNLRGDNAYGTLTVFAPGVDPLSEFTSTYQILRTYSVDGRRAFFIEFEDRTQPLFAWDYGGGTALLDVDDAVTRDEQRRVAEAFPPPAPRPVPLSFKVDYLPVGYRLTSIDSGSRGVGYAIGLDSTAAKTISVDVLSPYPDVDGLSTMPTCRIRTDGRTACGLMSADKRYSITASGDRGIPQSELFKILTSVRYTAGTTYPISDALPESALSQR